MSYQFLIHSVSQSWVLFCSYFGFYLRNIAFNRKCYKLQNICMLDMFTFDVLSVCYSLDQSVTVKAFFIFGLRPQEYSFSHNIYKMQNICLACQNILALYSCRDLCHLCKKKKKKFFQILNFFITFLSSLFSVCQICQLLRSYGQFDHFMKIP